MKPRIKLGTAKTADGSHLELIQHDKDYLLMVNGELLMSTRIKYSEGELAGIALESVPPKGARALIGGLGMGFTLRAVLDLLPDDSEVTQVELVPEIVEWNKGPLGAAAGYPVNDPRGNIVIANVAHVIRDNKNKYHAIMLDVDNGPSAMVSPQNAALYSIKGLARSYDALRKGGRLAIWSADIDVRFEQKMNDTGFKTRVIRVKGETNAGSPRHVIFLGEK